MLHNGPLNKANFRIWKNTDVSMLDIINDTVFWFYLPLATLKCCCSRGLAPPALDIWLTIWEWLTVCCISDLGGWCLPDCLRQPEKKNVLKVTHFYRDSNLSARRLFRGEKSTNVQNTNKDTTMFLFLNLMTHLWSLGGPRAHCAASQGWLSVCSSRSPSVGVPAGCGQRPKL